MGIQPAAAYSAVSFIANSPQQRQASASTTANSAASVAAALADKTTISQAARDRAAEDAKGGGSYDFTNMTPNQMRDVAMDLFKSGKIDSQQQLMLLATSFVGRFPATKEYTPPTDAEIAQRNNTPMNYVQYSKDRISYLESTGLTSDPQHGYESWKGLLALMQNATSSSAA
jgi:hypothetical protein